MYVTGTYDSNALYITGTGSILGHSGNGDIFLIKYNTSGVVQWANKIGGTGIESSPQLAVDSLNNVYVTGTYRSNPLYITGSTLGHSGNGDIFLVKYNTLGVVQWANKIGGTQSEYAAQLAVDSLNNVYVTGTYNSNPLYITGTGSTLGNSGNSTTSDIYVVKYNTSGVVEWANKIGGSSIENDSQLAVDNLNNVYVTGTYTSNPLYITGTGSTLSHSGNGDIFLIKYNTSGVVQWANKIGGTGTESVPQLTVDSLNNVYVTGTYDSNALYISGTGTTLGISGGSSDIYVIKYNDSGSVVWANKIGGTGNESTPQLATNTYNSINNTSYGNGALQNLQVGFNNTALGYNAGNNLIQGSNNIYIGENDEPSYENGTIRIGNSQIYTSINIGQPLTPLYTRLPMSTEIGFTNIVKTIGNTALATTPSNISLSPSFIIPSGTWITELSGSLSNNSGFAQIGLSTTSNVFDITRTVSTNANGAPSTAHVLMTTVIQQTSPVIWYVIGVRTTTALMNAQAINVRITRIV